MKLATPISHLFKDLEISKKLASYSDCLELRDHSVMMSNNLNPELFHSDLQLIHPIDEISFSELERIKVKFPSIKCISFHAASIFAKPIIEKSIFSTGKGKSTYDEMILCSIKNTTKIREIFGQDIKILVENNNYYDTPAYEIVTDPEFISKVVYENGLYFLFDIAHAKITAHNKGISYDGYKSSLPLDKLLQVHICKFGVRKDGTAFDAHYIPDRVEFEEVKKLLSKGKLKYLTIEYYKSGDMLLSALQKLRDYVTIP